MTERQSRHYQVGVGAAISLDVIGRNFAHFGHSQPTAEQSTPLRNCTCCSLPHAGLRKLTNMASSPSIISQTHDLGGRLAAFTSWVKTNLTGDEKGEAQIYLDRLFQAFGHRGAREAGAVLEERVRMSQRGGTAFADLVWKPLVLVEMKRRGEDPARHYRQAFDYWTRLVPNRPRYVVICNFDTFWIYDFTVQMDEPVARVALDTLATDYGPLLFLQGVGSQPVFGETHTDVTRAAADALAGCFNRMHRRGVERDVAQSFVLQALVALFAEDIGLLERYSVQRLLDECRTPADAYDLLGGLFTAMNTPGVTAGGRYKGVPYFNGGVFAKPARVELTAEELQLLKDAAGFTWSKVRPEIFGTIFEHSLDQDERHAYGAHFTSAADIMRIVGPTIVDPWRERIENATSIRQMRALLARLSHYRVLDPACGSGNFLYVAYRELKRIEAILYSRLAMLSKRIDPSQHELGFVTASNFYGIDINPFAVELAKVTMMLGRKLAIDELHVTENALPLDNLDANFIVGDALLTHDGAAREWPKVDAIIGNPPYLGAKRLKPERGESYVRMLRNRYPEVPGMADYCVYWFKKAHESLLECTPSDPLTGRAGLVGTQNISNNASRIGGLDHITASGTIVDAVDNLPWSGEAVVHVAIANWVKSQDPTVMPARRRLWKVVQRARTASGQLAKQRDKESDVDLTYTEVPHISSSLSERISVSQAHVLAASKEPQIAFQGVVPGYEGFLLEQEEAQSLAAKDPHSCEVIKPLLTGRDLLSGDGTPSRFVIDFANLDLDAASGYSAAFNYVREHVLPEVERVARQTAGGEMAKARAEHANRWWQFWNVRKSMRTALAETSRYLACSRVTKRPIFVFVAQNIVPDTALQVFALPDDYSFGIMQSVVHWQWFVAKCSKLKADYRYTAESVFLTFPWPQWPSDESIRLVAQCAREVRAAREVASAGAIRSLRELYRALDLPGESRLRDAQDALDAAVIDCYGFDASADVLTQLLRVNSEVHSRERDGMPVNGPGLPHSYNGPADVITTDCVQASPEQRLC
jgi:hypothetical protein